MSTVSRSSGCFIGLLLVTGVPQAVISGARLRPGLAFESPVAAKLFRSIKAA